jgi:cytochrome c oxidase assembly protein subunit 15
MPDLGKIGKYYRRSIRTSFYLVLFLVLIGGLVRSTGAGMGCPDWPKCYGLWVPPTHISEVPDKYWSDPLCSVDGQLIFNPIKTWTEYLNRLLGVLVGFAIFVQLLFALFYREAGKSRIFSLVAFILVAFQGWLGAKVVSTDLKPLVISLHLLVALLIGFSLLAALFHARIKTYQGSPYRPYTHAPLLLWTTTLLLVLQFFLGTEVRAQVDVLFRKFDFSSRDLYSSQLNWVFLVHRSFSVLVMVFCFLQIFAFGKQLPIRNLYQATNPFFLTLGLIFTGIVLAYLEFPALVQPFHLALGYSILCAQFWLILYARFSIHSTDGSD